MTTKPTKPQLTQDRSYYRLLTNKELIERVGGASRNPDADYQELAIVLAERVEDLKHKLDHHHYDAVSDARAWE